MASRKVFVGLSVFLAVLVAALGLGMDVMSMTSAADDEKAKPGLIEITVTDEADKLEMPAAVFLHGEHAEALEKRGKDCSACHAKSKNRQGEEVLSWRFKGVKEAQPSALKDVYHEGCISCHAKDRAEDAEAYGPQAGECRKCHQEDPEYTAARVAPDMDNALHFRHWGSKEIPDDEGYKTNCGSCHHQYDKASDKLVYVKFEEEDCSYCHTANPDLEGEVKLDTVEAFHSQCVVCHKQMKEAKVEKAGPTDCAGCHGEKAWAKLQAKNAEMLKKLGGELPRLPRKQPDAVLMVPPKPEDQAQAEKPEQQAQAMPVAFNHLLHERETDSCEQCHHKSVKSCAECHTLQGAEDSDFISLEQAMHQPDSEHSCVGCHAEQQQAAECAGCHAAMKQTATPEAGACQSCHLESRTRDAESVGADAVVLPLPEDKETRQAMAKKIVAKRPDEPLLAAKKDIPEKVTIDALADEYKPSEMPHRKIVLKLVENMKGDSLATAFHDSKTAICQGCHHNSPASATPPSCKSCHAKPFMEGRSGRPGLKAAYHGQCMDCHDAMQLEKPKSRDCVACHKKKN
jgi:hypothetical protein